MACDGWQHNCDLPTNYTQLISDACFLNKPALPKGLVITLTTAQNPLSACNAVGASTLNTGESRHKSQAKWTPGFTVLVGYVNVQGYRFLLFLSAAVVENTDTVSSVHLPCHAEIE